MTPVRLEPGASQSPVKFSTPEPLRSIKRMPFKGISYLELWKPICSAERTHLCNFGGGYYEQQFCKIILNLDMVQEMSTKMFYNSGALAALLFSGVELFMKF